MRSRGLAPAVERGGAIAVSAAQEQTIPLAVGQPVAREMRGGEEHSYQVKLSAGQYARIVVGAEGHRCGVGVVRSGWKTTPRSG